jgi:ABC-type multidrug transport system fused ATPase/permease subunit
LFRFELIGQIVVIAVDTHAFVFVGIPSIFLFVVLLVFYSRTSRNLQRLDSISRSKVLSHFSQTVSGGGLSIIRSYEVEEKWKKSFYEYNDLWSIRFISSMGWHRPINRYLTTFILFYFILLFIFQDFFFSMKESSGQRYVLR